jgi:hypothetical protein
VRELVTREEVPEDVVREQVGSLLREKEAGFKRRWAEATLH